MFRTPAGVITSVSGVKQFMMTFTAACWVS